ncbi:hypothetical protein [Natronolimnohabitans innermongolicus]|uniref:Uncharacterized protein n=1 Tax=Natronolimnohabitans innermongolicus JCM 12255 TaxID=1227499 RepID=L9X325_9EURY|nr:hypothetical protein [Natronolimnohabitans innermongolicus]ELY55881.1 hypothetical protein C493_10398 [Natronolimnohabitans innermongolicus JCM 12255]
MREFLESDTGFYYAIGLFTIAVFLGALAMLAVVTPGGIGALELGGLVVGFGLFMLVYFVSITIHQLEDREEL